MRLAAALFLALTPTLIAAHGLSDINVMTVAATAH